MTICPRIIPGVIIRPGDDIAVIHYSHDTVFVKSPVHAEVLKVNPGVYYNSWLVCIDNDSLSRIEASLMTDEEYLTFRMKYM